MPEIRLRRPPMLPNAGACRGCAATIRWYTTEQGKAMPMNADADPLRVEGEAILVFDAAGSHWATCPQAKSFKRKIDREDRLR